MTSRNDRWSGVAALAGLLVLGACAGVDGRGLRPGVATAEAVRAQMGEPYAVMREADGGQTWQYPRGPLGRQTFMVRLGADGRLVGIEQVLDDTGFGRIAAGQSRDDVLRLLGPPCCVIPFERRGETAWDYRFTDVWLRPAIFSVIFDDAGRVRSTLVVPELPLFERD
ncbi:MAG: outer membrane protein assembly factor BamE [Betaproteobacteria bacterium]|nr:outer membrane protein assembly factor BamE [Betaproteobacteria bacterium]